MNKLHCAAFLMRVVVFVLLFSNALAQAAHKPRFCGAALSAVLDAVCINGFNTKFVRSTTATAASTSTGAAYKTTWHGWMGARRTRMLHGIVHECCRNGCIYEDLIKYCR